MSTIAERLREERERLAFTRDEFAAQAGITLRPYHDWEAGRTAPTAVHLAALSYVGADVRYIVTGERDWHPYTVEEQQLVNNYRAMRSLLPRPAKQPKKSRSVITINAPGGHVVGRDLTISTKEDKKNE